MYMNLYIASILASVAISSAITYQIQSWRFDAKEKAHAEQKLVEVQQSAATAIRQLDNVLVAQNAGAARAIRLRSDLDSARTELDRLRAQLAKPLPRASDTPGTCPDRADPARELLATCATELQAVAGAADRHASDALMLQQAWPK